MNFKAKLKTLRIALAEWLAPEFREAHKKAAAREVAYSLRIKHLDEYIVTLQAVNTNFQAALASANMQTDEMYSDSYRNMTPEVQKAWRLRMGFPQTVPKPEGMGLKDMAVEAEKDELIEALERGELVLRAMEEESGAATIIADRLAQAVTYLRAEKPFEESEIIRLSPFEIQSGHDRVKWAEGLIRQLPEDHDGRNSWLLNYGEKK